MPFPPYQKPKEMCNWKFLCFVMGEVAQYGHKSKYEEKMNTIL